MTHDAFSAGVEPGGLYSSQEIKILICYMLDGAGEPLARQAVLDIVAAGGMANYFEAGAAIDELIRMGQLTESEDGHLSPTDMGRQTASTLSGRIPFTLRERSLKAAMQLLTRIRRERENHVTVEPAGLGKMVTCTIQDADAPLLSVSLRVADDMQADLVKEHFLNDPTLIYQSLIALLTGDAAWKRLDTQIVIDLK